MNKEKLRYAILKEVSNGNTELTEAELQVTAEDFDEAVNYLVREGLLKGVQYNDNRPHLYAIGPVLSGLGESYLKENSSWSKLYKGLKEIRDWLK